MTLRESTLRAMYEAGEVQTSFEFSADKLIGWEVYPIYSRGDLAGGWIVNGHEIHTAILEKYQARINWKKWLKLYISPLLEERKYLLSYVSKTDKKTLNFALRIGMKIIHEDYKNLYLKLEDILCL